MLPHLICRPSVLDGPLLIGICPTLETKNDKDDRDQERGCARQSCYRHADRPASGAFGVSSEKAYASDTEQDNRGGDEWAPATLAAIRDYARIPSMLLVAATDNNHQGGIYGDRIRAIAEEPKCKHDRFVPRGDAWNEDLRPVLQEPEA